MKKAVIDPNRISVRNTFHFGVQRKYKTHIVENKKAYNRKRLPKIEY